MRAYIRICVIVTKRLFTLNLHRTVPFTAVFLYIPVGGIFKLSVTKDHGSLILRKMSEMYENYTDRWMVYPCVGYELYIRFDTMAFGWHCRSSFQQNDKTFFFILYGTCIHLLKCCFSFHIVSIGTLISMEHKWYSQNILFIKVKNVKQAHCLGEFGALIAIIILTSTSKLRHTFSKTNQCLTTNQT